MWYEITLLFSEMGVASAICLVLGLIFIIIEIFNPGFGFFGISGIILLIAGMALRVSDGGKGNPLAQLLLMILISVIVIIIAFSIMTYSAKKGYLSRTPIVMKDSALPTGITSGTEDYSFLIGKEGLTATSLRPSGIVTIDGKRYDVVALGTFIDINTTVEVIQVEGVRIVVNEKLNNVK